ncbi:hypothetical protein RSJ42_00910 [Methanosarcina hadiensis]|uniref:hypothetical protein n=1 Tax=Methanosarcina hadiensis TaxID=3078083 RepID=UPI0039778B78
MIFFLPESFVNGAYLKKVVLYVCGVQSSFYFENNCAIPGEKVLKKRKPDPDKHEIENKMPQVKPGSFPAINKFLEAEKMI